MRYVLLFALAFVFTLTSTLSLAQNGPERFEGEVTRFEQEDMENPPGDNIVLFTGSSSVRMYKDLAEHFPDHNVLNRGFGGSQFSDLMYYYDKLILPYDPVKVFIYEGDNDIEAGEDPAEILEEAATLRQMLEQQLPGVPVAFISAKPSVARWHLKDQYVTLNQGLKELAESTDNTEYVDVWTPMLDENGEVYTDIFVEDNLHMNEKGYEIWREALLPYMPEDAE
ncbi:SGNH/GDSL hydrolase family protein [Roseivirga sp. BDSF3-8]|uniref:SGNH/GDSL hydrolase family protein n=1 Tax=Roseivirga sp. BDSF3-8 TaxID=3241598 RepID=UPI00353243C8